MVPLVPLIVVLHEVHAIATFCPTITLKFQFKKIPVSNTTTKKRRPIFTATVGRPFRALYTRANVYGCEYLWLHICVRAWITKSFCSDVWSVPVSVWSFVVSRSCQCIIHSNVLIMFVVRYSTRADPIPNQKYLHLLNNRCSPVVLVRYCLRTVIYFLYLKLL